MSKDALVKNEATLAVGNSPADMIRLAVGGGVDLDKLAKLLDLQEKWESNEARKAYHRAMSEFKANPIEILKDKKVGYESKTGGRVGYTHASLANVVRKVTKELSKYGLSASWRTAQNGQISVTCKITHVMGHSEETTLSAPSDTSGSKNAIQAIGSTISYLERYTLLAALGLATADQDDDGRATSKDGSPVAMPKKKEPEAGAKPEPVLVSFEEAKALDEAARKTGLTDKLFQLINQNFGVDSYKQLTQEQYKRAMEWIAKQGVKRLGRPPKANVDEGRDPGYEG